KTDALHRPVFWIERNACRRPGQNGRVVAGIHSNHFTLEYFNASRAKHDDSSGQRARARRIARRAPEHAFDHVHYRPMVIPSNFWMVHRSEKSHSPSRRAVLSRSRSSFYCDADVDAHQADTTPITSGHPAERAIGATGSHRDWRCAAYRSGRKCLSPRGAGTIWSAVIPTRRDFEKRG